MKHKVILEGAIVKKVYMVRNMYFYGIYEEDNSMDKYLSDEILEKEKRDNGWLADYMIGDVRITHSYRNKKKKSVIWQGELDCPVMKSGDTLRIKDTQKEFKIRKVIRDTEGNYVYQTDVVVEISNKEDEESMKAAVIEKYENAKKKHEEEKKKAAEVEKDFKKEVSRLRKERNNWFTRLFK